MCLISKSSAISGKESISMYTNCTPPVKSSAAPLSNGLSIPHGPHHDAPAYKITGMSDSRYFSHSSRFCISMILDWPISFENWYFWMKLSKRVLGIEPTKEEPFYLWKVIRPLDGWPLVSDLKTFAVRVFRPEIFDPIDFISWLLNFMMMCNVYFLFFNYLIIKSVIILL